MRRDQVITSFAKESTRVILSVFILLAASLLVTQPERESITIKSFHKKTTAYTQKHKTSKKSRNPSSDLSH